jgi:hypothetical protein
MYRWKIFFEDEDTGKQDYLGKINADTMAEALEAAAEKWDYDSGDLVAEQIAREEE